MTEPQEPTGPPKDLDAYSVWLQREHDVDTSDRLRTRYNAVVARLREELLESAYWKDVETNLVPFDDAYRLGAEGYPLFYPEPEVPEVVTKPFESFLEKTYRRNVLENRGWPEPPATGWLLPDDWYGAVNDLVRTSLVVKYLDGVEFLGVRLREIAERHRVHEELTYEARMEGYYAAHVNSRHEFTIPDINWDTRKVAITVEVQVTTQLQEVIKRLLHRYYETRRVRAGSAQDAWQWNYRNDEFVANYLGHILHYVEGMIMEVRSRQSTGSANGKANGGRAG